MTLPEMKPKTRTTLDAGLEREARREAEAEADAAVTIPEYRVGETCTFSAVVPVEANDVFEAMYASLKKRDRRISKKMVMAALLSACESPEVVKAVVERIR